jgi:hypothetical protein
MLHGCNDTTDNKNANRPCRPRGYCSVAYCMLMTDCRTTGTYIHDSQRARAASWVLVKVPTQQTATNATRNKTQEKERT